MVKMGALGFGLELWQGSGHRVRVRNRTTRPNSHEDHMTPNQGQG